MPMVYICDDTWQDLLYAESVLDGVDIENPTDAIRALVNVLDEWLELREEVVCKK